ncbi:NTP transferase domain-containing protein [Trueperella pecoris]|uniref:NTP transferase domain-containing protein n=1 Tax=Trueperella pecoris TaxID=2733571 RepID=A0A7M1R1E1_9ACTO|nr:NTP transferase domain-containing protein [Trueperella pecoris]QOR47941.1 NTP transferase domain-containing protein [Trueperella pecoris]
MNLAAVIVQAGGTGARLGGASKPDYLVGGRRLLDVFFAELAAAGFAGVSIVVAPGEVAVPPGAIRTLEDPPHGGPLAGIVAGLAQLEGLPDSALVGLGACDAPLSPRLFPALASSLERSGGGVGSGSLDGVIPASGEGHHRYLHGVYRLGALRGLEFVRHGAIRPAFSALNLSVVDDPHDWCFDVDTSDDAEALAVRL